MPTRHALVAGLAAALLAGGWLACSGRVGGVPRNLTLVAATDSTVALAWDEPDAGTPDQYFVYFRQVGTGPYLRVKETVETDFTHDPAGMTGWYRVTAQFAADEYYAPETLTTVPVETPEDLVVEFSLAGNSGFGWDRATGAGLSYPMRQDESADAVDFYVTDFALGYAGPAYSIASPTYGPSDPSGEVPQAPWRMSRFTAELPDERAPLPRYSDIVYQTARVVHPGLALGCRTEDGHYAMVKVTEVNTLTGQVRLRSWFQLVPGLRLIRH
ncbi:MAG: fibronectin type III domain-containing protein [bacterium]